MLGEFTSSLGRRTTAKVKLFTEFWEDISETNSVRFKLSIIKGIGREWNGHVVVVHCRVQ